MGPALAELRRALGISQSQLATKVYCDRSLIAQIETGRVRISEDRYRDIAAVLLAEADRRPANEFASNVAMASLVMATALRADRSLEDERHVAQMMVVHEESLGAIQRLALRWSKGDTSIAPEFTAPLVGLSLLHPDVEVDLLVSMMRWWRAQEPTAVEYLGDSHLLYAMYLANSVLASISGGAATIRELAQASIISRAANPPLERLAVLRGLADHTVDGVLPSNVGHYRQFLENLERGLVGTLPAGTEVVALEAGPRTSRAGDR
ncbi:MAG: helix-turn-helix transcriptional regulator [Chloroflexi bacterium]|nr:helix-turn-helix transcriptional regulator [Chloroflexota bacterium]